MVNAPVRESAMEIAGTNVMGQAATYMGVLDAAGLAGWNVQKLPMWADTRDYPTTPLASPAGIRDESTFKTAGMIDGRLTLLGTVGDQYSPVQNEEHAEFMDEVASISGGYYTQATAFYGGKLVYVSIQLPEIVSVGGVDPVKLFLNGINSHDGSTHFMLNLSPERAWCANQLNYFRKDSIKFKHSGNIRDKIELAKRAVEATLEDVKNFGVHAARLADTPMAVGQFQHVVDSIYPMPPAPGEDGHKVRTWNNYTRLRDGIDGMLAAPHNAQIRDTAWGGMNAVIEYLEWGHGSDARRAERIMTSKDLTDKIVKVRDTFSKFALAA